MRAVKMHAGEYFVNLGMAIRIIRILTPHSEYRLDKPVCALGLDARLRHRINWPGCLWDYKERSRCCALTVKSMPSLTRKTLIARSYILIDCVFCPMAA